jgi:CBS domain containing-hemolysin-like protein
MGRTLTLLEEAGHFAEDLILWLSLAVLIATIAAETAIRNFRWPRLEEMVCDRTRLDRIQADLRSERRVLDGIISFRLLASFILLLALMGFFAPNNGLGPTVDMGEFLKDLGVVLLIFLVGLFGIIRGIARAVPERTLLLVLGPSKAIARIFAPLVWLTDAAGKTACRALGLQRAEVTEEARHGILDAVTEGERGGAIDDEGREMIENIIDVQDQSVKEVMTPRTSVFAIPLETSLDDAVRLVAEQGHSRVPVFSGTIDNVQGVVYAKDLLAHWGRRGGSLPALKEVMRPPLFVPETKKTSELLNELRGDHVHVAIVLDEYGGMSGLVTIEDLLEEIVGEIEDEYDRKDGREEAPVRRIDENVAEVAAAVHIDELNEALDLALPEAEGYDTLGGFISAKLGRVPGRGETCDFENVRFEILDADARRINRVKVVVGE